MEHLSNYTEGGFSSLEWIVMLSGVHMSLRRFLEQLSPDSFSSITFFVCVCVRVCVLVVFP